MPAGPHREPSHRLHAGEPRVGEEPSEGERTAEVARPRAGLVGPVEAKHENTALAGAGEEPIEIAEHRPLNLRVAVARDRQSQRHDHDRDLPRRDRSLRGRCRSGGRISRRGDAGCRAPRQRGEPHGQQRWNPNSIPGHPPTRCRRESRG